MKTLSYLCDAVIAVALLFTSCKKSSTPSPNIPFMEFTANGTHIFFNDCEETATDANNLPATKFVGTVLINGTPGSASFEATVIHAPSALKVGQTYPIATYLALADRSTLVYYPNNTDMFTSQSANADGIATITDVTDTTISGTFSGTLFEGGNAVTYTITNGSFKAKINK
jgi:hypothetical protein